MLEGHVLREFLPQTLQQSPLFQFHEFFHGLTAPAFLFGSGLTFVIATRRRWEEYHHWDKPLARRVRRLLYVLLLGLMLNLPFFSIRKIIMDGVTADYLQLFRCDVLICIAVGLLSLHAIIFLFKNEKHFYLLVIGTIVAVAFLTPLVWELDFLAFLPIPVAQLLNSNHGSLFPLFPFVGFLYAGVIVSWEFTVAMERHQERKFMLWLMGIGAGFVIGGLGFDFVPLQLYPTYNFWYTAPTYFFIRLGVLMILISGFWFVVAKATSLNPRYLLYGKESLFVYVLHLLVLYGSAMNPETNLRKLLGPELSVSWSLGLFIALALTMFLSAFIWDYLKERHRPIYRVIQVAGAIWFLRAFFLKDY